MTNPLFKRFLLSTPAPFYYSVFNTEEQRLQIDRMQLWCAAALHKMKQQLAKGQRS